MKIFNQFFKAAKTPKNITSKTSSKSPQNVGSKNSVSKENMIKLIDKITNQFKDRSRKDIDKWRQSLMLIDHFDKPNFTVYCDLIDDLLTDATVKALMQLRFSATLSIDTQIRNKRTGEVNEQATELFNQKWFFKYKTKYLEAIVNGSKVIEFSSFKGHNIEFNEIPKRNTATNFKRIYPNLNSNSYIDYTNPIYSKWIIQLGDDDLGLMNNIVPNILWKRNVAQSWAEFCEKFGMPLVSATTNKADEEHLDAVEQQLLNLAEASIGVFPDGTTIKFDEANRTDAYNVYSKFIEQNSNEISAVIVGSNTLTANAANRSQTEVHERSLDFKISQADRREITFNVNDELIPLLIAQGYDELSEDDVLEWIESKEEIGLMDYWTIVQGIMQSREIPDEWLSSTFNIPIEGKKITPLFPEPDNNVTSILNLLAKADANTRNNLSDAILKTINQHQNAIQNNNPEQEDSNQPASTWKRPEY